MTPERVLVTGASRGIGRAVVQRLLASDRGVIAVARTEAALSELKREAPERVEVLVADLLQPEGLAKACDAAVRVDGLVHAAGLAEHRVLERIEDEQIERAFGLHLRVPLHLSRALVSGRRESERGGAIVFVASTLGVRPAPGTIVYSASKAALLNMTKALAAELAPDGVCVNAVAPGAVDTAMIRSRSEAELEALRKQHLLGRLGTPQEVADAVVYLLDAQWVTGATLTIDGGLTAT